ncbi:MAG: acyl-CoA thioesterase [Proteobacteria bacterium]|nr:acyl-CoA thioesterase [Pseudomonadota bacterium]
MLQSRIKYRVIYGDTDNMGYAYNANYLRWFEMGRGEMFRNLGLTYKTIEEKGYFMPLSEVQCKFLFPAKYDDVLVIETTLDASFKGGMKFTYRILDEEEKIVLATGASKHAFVNKNRKIVRPPDFVIDVIKKALAGI